MADTTTAKRYPSLPEDVETEQKIVDEIKKLEPLALKLKAFAINKNLLEIKELEAEQQQQIAKIDMETRKACQPDVDRLNQLITGDKLKDEEIGNLSEYFTEEELAKKDELLANVKTIEDYWIKCIQNHGGLKEAISENDNDAVALKSLKRIEYVVSEDAARPVDFTLKFYFAENDFFTNEVLTAEFFLKEVREPKKIVGTDINWKEGKNLTKKTIQKKQKNKKTGATRTVTKTEDCNSLFTLFNSIEMPEGKQDDLDEDDQTKLGDCYTRCDWGYSFFDELIPFSMEYYLGVKKDQYGGEDEDYDDDDMGDEDLGDEDDDDDDINDPPKGKKKGGKGGKATAGGAPGKDPKDCKQQ